MGSVETLAHKGTGVVCQAVKKILGECTEDPTLQPCILEVSDQGLRMVDRSKPDVSCFVERNCESIIEVSSVKDSSHYT